MTMNARARRTHRRNQIIAICNQLRSDSLSTRHGLDINNFEDESLHEIVMECASFDYMSDPEKRLAVVAFTEGTDAAKNSIWNK